MVVDSDKPVQTRFAVVPNGALLLNEIKSISFKEADHFAELHVIVRLCPEANRLDYNTVGARGLLRFACKDRCRAKWRRVSGKSGTGAPRTDSSSSTPPTRAFPIPVVIGISDSTGCREVMSGRDQNDGWGDGTGVG